MTREVPLIHPGEILLKDWLEPLGISQYALAKAIDVPRRRINEIVQGHRAITADTAARLGAFFCIDAEGWLHTGDCGEIDENGYVAIRDRIKDILITSGGKNITPSELENELKFSPYITDAVVIGDKRPYLTVIIMIDQENVEKYAQDHDVPFSNYASLTRAPQVQALIQDAGKKVFLILDNLRVHHSKPVKAWVDEHKDKIELFYLPSYSPELNPEERLNADLKQAMGKRVPVRTKAKLRDAANEHMAMLEKSPERVMSYFQDPRVKYAAG